MLSVFCLPLSLALLSLSSAQSTTLVPTTTIGPSPQYTDDATFRTAILNSTNFFRLEHNATVVVWNSSLADFAQHTADSCDFSHSGGPYGENLAMGYPNVTASVEGWGLERSVYDFSHPGFSEQTGHFTQLVWKNTSSVGCGRKNCDGVQNAFGWMLVCEYYPRGNVIGAFDTQVQSQVVTIDCGVNGTGTANGTEGGNGTANNGTSDNGTCTSAPTGAASRSMLGTGLGLMVGALVLGTVL
jgi:uncharacterized protein YkwD